MPERTQQLIRLKGKYWQRNQDLDPSILTVSDDETTVHRFRYTLLLSWALAKLQKVISRSARMFSVKWKHNHLSYAIIEHGGLMLLISNFDLSLDARR